MTKIAAATGLSRESLYRSLSPTGNPELATILKVVIALGLRLDAVSASDSATGLDALSPYSRQKKVTSGGQDLPSCTCSIMESGMNKRFESTVIYESSLVDAISSEIPLYT